MSNEIVKYENRLNSIPLRRFNTREMNLFFSLASRLRDKGTNEIELSFTQLKSLSQYKDHGERFVEDLNRTYHKLLTLNAATDDGHRITAFVLFTKYVIDRDSETVNIAVNPEFKGLFNELSNWTRFSLEQFASLKSTYSKTMFRLLKQYRTVGFREFTMNDFRVLMDVPETYRPSEIDKRALKPIKEELASMFRGLSIRKIYKGRGGKVVGYRFTWKPEPKNANDFTDGQALSHLPNKKITKRIDPVPDYQKNNRKITEKDRKRLAEQLDLLRSLGQQRTTN
ncbi:MULTISPECIES: replication initiation protein [Lactobacillales]|uniref:replication initiation protein n=1 Tax=Lactobacillales TaxID=186826 RepID=UPI0002977CB1|nr:MULTISPECIES: replication initiation protein [Lactobacillales]MDN5580031.1 replication initiation protein [Lactococcus raffinolactis]MDN6590156.1 replication initiation protein [Lactobacillus sp.]MDN6689543.1 replication initiation protein [Lactococcus sp.]MDN6765270.1 replication initiation protein [Lactiplantibacillus plantarum]NMN63534.1 Protein involved in initiation of plasmid replication [Lacticaseibacillus casei]